MVITRVWCNRNNRFEAFDTCRCCRDRDRAVIGSPRHPNLTRTPGGFDFCCAIDGCKALCTAIQPINNCLRCEPFRRPSNGRATFRQAGSRRFRMDNCKATGYPSPNQRTGNHRSIWLKANLRMTTTRWWNRTELMADIPQNGITTGCTGKVRA